MRPYGIWLSTHNIHLWISNKVHEQKQYYSFPGNIICAQTQRRLRKKAGNKISNHLTESTVKSEKASMWYAMCNNVYYKVQATYTDNFNLVDIFIVVLRVIQEWSVELVKTLD